MRPPGDALGSGWTRARGAPVLQGPELALLGARPGGVRTRGVLANQLAA